MGRSNAYWTSNLYLSEDAEPGPCGSADRSRSATGGAL